MSKDWIGNASVRNCNIRNNNDDQNDYYATEPQAVELLLQEESFCREVWEPACGEGHVSEVLKAHGYNVYSTDLVNRGYGDCHVNFFKIQHPINRDIITNPPYKFAKEFVEHALDVVTSGHNVAMFLKLTFLEGAKRKALFDKYPPKKIYVFRNRVDCWKNGIEPKKASRAVCYAWFIWTKGFNGPPTIDWIN